MAAQGLLAAPSAAFRCAMQNAGFQDLDLVSDLDSEYGVYDFMLLNQRPEQLQELVDYLSLILADETIAEWDLGDLISRCDGDFFEDTARASLLKLRDRAKQLLQE